MSPIIYTPHDCEFPPVGFPVGSLWQCPECDKIWELMRAAGAYGAKSWYIEANPRRDAILCDAATTAPTPTVTPDMVQLVLNTYKDHMVVVPNDGAEPLGWCGECETAIYGPHTIQAHALSITAEVLQDALDKAGRDAAQ